MRLYHKAKVSVIYTLAFLFKKLTYKIRIHIKNHFTFTDTSLAHHSVCFFVQKINIQNTDSYKKSLYFYGYKSCPSFSLK
uniref:Uncharacterized protein n=1 Tax=uncultured bacterium A1Q1_fos_97 TaxID=1256593 RepID=L7VZF5_9BACT|nr:hypothetical protein [uncultured bacterium A1Q1_fos_97]